MFLMGLENLVLQSFFLQVIHSITDYHQKEKHTEKQCNGASKQEGQRQNQFRDYHNYAFLNHGNYWYRPRGNELNIL